MISSILNIVLAIFDPYNIKKFTFILSYKNLCKYHCLRLRNLTHNILGLRSICTILMYARFLEIRTLKHTRILLYFVKYASF